MNSFIASLLFAVCLLVSSHAFMAIRHPHRHHFGGSPFTTTEDEAYSPLSSVPKLNDVDLMAIENVAELCMDTDKAIRDGCDLEQYDALVHRLQAQRAMMLDQVEYIDDLLNRLQGNSAMMVDDV
mmetsp:Transcript_9237/g.22031  ORF Transcript_9237/g.22031 Transcript_9237/m.22031 type:complete len:125 (+) Transcript_9237:113-487(+)|eukprot:CAMPEP_0113619100 /NCGR_PEP_ID=MMETSP0017_2-20120614/9690_1 /TAXON_ID=2856 /ORGANISM="Cylindrotheca closterium" /LENGTH=124 /DNA_ID=CAMNT_0000528653 /DNA_START=56 /DNA_END=430 /DNA_ORIENTATION=+ /assembly_acc=CAM_ASM_000147